VSVDLADAEAVGMVDTGAPEDADVAVVAVDPVEPVVEMEDLVVEEEEDDDDDDVELEDEEDDIEEEEVLARSFSAAFRLATSFASSSSVRPYEKPRPCLFASYGDAV
jgi:hypothetical protein